MNPIQRKPKPRPSEDRADHLDGLLDHLGRLLAEEYVALLTTRPEDEPADEENP